jgi:hypothetical protein
MTASGATLGERLAELVRLQAEQARGMGHQPGEMVPGSPIIVVRFNPETRPPEMGSRAQLGG